MAFDLAADAGEPGFDIRRRRQSSERTVRVVARRGSLVTARGQTGKRLAQRRKPRGVTRHLTFGLGKSIPCRVRFVLERAPAGAGGGLRLGGGHDIGLGGRHRRLFRVDLPAQRV